MAESFALTEATYYILLSLVKPRHGYGIMQLTEELSGGRVRLAAGTLYGALNALSTKGWIIQLPIADESRRKEYCLTEKGLQVHNAVSMTRPDQRKENVVSRFSQRITLRHMLTSVVIRYIVFRYIVNLLYRHPI